MASCWWSTSSWEYSTSERYERAARKADTSSKCFAEWWKDEGRVGQSIQRCEGEKNLSPRLEIKKIKLRDKILEEEEAGDWE